jgi:hypothetical protein
LDIPPETKQPDEAEEFSEYEATAFGKFLGNLRFPTILELKPEDFIFMHLN